MERVISRGDFKFYTMLKQIIFDLDLANKEYWWLISDFEAHPQKIALEDFIRENCYILIKTSELLKMLEKEDFQWIWAVFSVIPIDYTE